MTWSGATAHAHSSIRFFFRFHAPSTGTAHGGRPRSKELSHGFGTGPGALGRAPTSYHDRSAAAERLGTAPARKRLARTAFRSLSRAQTAIGGPRNSFCFPCAAESTGALEAVPHTRSRRGGRCGCRRRRHCKQRAAALSAVRVTRRRMADAPAPTCARRRRNFGGGETT